MTPVTYDIFKVNPKNSIIDNAFLELDLVNTPLINRALKSAIQQPHVYPPLTLSTAVYNVITLLSGPHL